MEGEVKERPMIGKRALTPSGKGFLLPLPVDEVSTAADRDILRKLVGAFQPGVGYAIVNQGQLCYDQHGQAHIYVLPAQARKMLDAVGAPPGYEIVQVLTADRSRCTGALV